MRRTGPVTQREHVLEDGCIIVSATNLKSRITYCNAAFVQASGYTRDELIGQPHNLIRHPDVPAEAFRDLWATIESGRPWSGVVKNRRKNGDHYWVCAHVTPVIENGQVTGYLSVRTKPERAQVEAAEALFARMRAEAAGGRLVTVLRAGRVLRDTRAARLARALRPGWGARLALGIAALPLAGAGAALALHGHPHAAPLALGGALALGAAFAALLRRSALAPLREARRVAERMAAGDLTQTMAAPPDGEAARLAGALTQLGINLQAVVGDVRREVAGIETASREIASGNQDLSARTESQAGSLQQTAAALEQVTTTIRRNADAAAQAAALAGEARAIAEAGGGTALEAGERMAQIRESSLRIADITGVIDGIAFQTGLLSLNAAVEAARAGEAGRGFAVVAAEVRALAQRASGAAREIRQLIDDAVARVEAGSRLVADTGATVQRTLDAVGRVHGVVAEISDASAQQAGGVAEVSTAMAHLDDLTQRNAAMVEQLAASAHSLDRQAVVVRGAVRIFRGA